MHRTFTLFFFIHSGAPEVPLLFLLDFLASDPCTEHIAAAIKDDQVCVCAGPECALPILNAKTPRRIERHTFDCFTERTPRKHEKLRTHMSRVMMLKASKNWSVRIAQGGDALGTHLPARVSVPSRYNSTPFAKRLPSRHSCTPSLRCGSRIFMATATL